MDKSDKNIYIKAMEIGYKSNNGITYFQLKNEIENSFNLKIQWQAEYSFIVWFMNNFTSIGYDNSALRIKSTFLQRVRYYLSGNNGENDSNSRAYTTELEKTFFINGETIKQYIDYLELVHAKKAANRAFKISLLSILIALLAFLSPILFSNPKPPYDVNILNKEIILMEEKLEKIDQNLDAIIKLNTIEKGDSINK